jgi:hypothetical protein
MDLSVEKHPAFTLCLTDVCNECFMVKRKVKQGVLPAERVESLMAGAEAHVGEKPTLVGAPKPVHPSLPERTRRPGGERVS